MVSLCKGGIEGVLRWGGVCGGGYDDCGGFLLGWEICFSLGFVEYWFGDEVGGNGFGSGLDRWRASNARRRFFATLERETIAFTAFSRLTS